MLPPTSRFDPKGYYAQLGLDAAAGAEAITAAFRRKARTLHPDVPVTGNTEAFVAVRQAYDVLSHPDRRQAYDRAAREAHDRAVLEAMARDAATKQAAARMAARGAPNVTEPPWFDGDLFDPRSNPSPSPPRSPRPVRSPRFSDLPMAVWAGVGLLLCVGVVQSALHLRSPPAVGNAGIRPNAAPVEPLSPVAQRAVLYGPNPVRLAGTPNFYVIPASGPTMLWRKEAERDAFVPIGQLPPFSSVQALHVNRQTGLMEVRFNDASNAFVDARRLTPGNGDAARRAYCAYNAGVAPYDGEVLERRGQGSGTLQVDNQSVQPAVVKLRDLSGAVALSLFLGPGGHSEFKDLPAGTYRAEFAIGELWSRACNTFAAGMRARRLLQPLATTTSPMLVLPAGDDPAAADISDQAFEQD